MHPQCVDCGLSPSLMTGFSSRPGIWPHAVLCGLYTVEVLHFYVDLTQSEKHSFVYQTHWLENIWDQRLCIGRVVSKMQLVGASVFVRPEKEKHDEISEASYLWELITHLTDVWITYHVVLWAGEMCQTRQNHRGFCRNDWNLRMFFSMQFLGRERKRGRSPSKGEIIADLWLLLNK